MADDINPPTDTIPVADDTNPLADPVAEDTNPPADPVANDTNPPADPVADDTNPVAAGVLQWLNAIRNLPESPHSVLDIRSSTSSSTSGTSSQRFSSSSTELLFNFEEPQHGLQSLSQHLVDSSTDVQSDSSSLAGNASDASDNSVQYALFREKMNGWFAEGFLTGANEPVNTLGVNTIVFSLSNTIHGFFQLGWVIGGASGIYTDARDAKTSILTAATGAGSIMNYLKSNEPVIVSVESYCILCLKWLIAGFLAGSHGRSLQ